MLCGHGCLLNCHPGVSRTTLFLKHYFRWESWKRVIKDYVAACSICAHSKSNTQRPSGLLQPLPTPHHPWSHIALDFVTGQNWQRWNRHIILTDSATGFSPFKTSLGYQTPLFPSIEADIAVPSVLQHL